MAGRLPGLARSSAAKRLRSGTGISTTSMARLVRRKPWVKTAGLVRRSWATMSRWTMGVAVAVRAMMGAGRRGREVIAQGAVVGAKVVPPLRDAMRFVDGDQRGRTAGEHLREAGNAHAFGSDEEKVESAGEVVATRLASVLAGQAGVDAGHTDAGWRRAWLPGHP